MKLIKQISESLCDKTDTIMTDGALIITELLKSINDKLYILSF